MPEKPSYLGLLNGIALFETQAHAYLTAWMAVTPSPDVKAVLAKVAAREGEHGMSFAKRINELGFELQPKDDPKQAERLAYASSDLPDVEKMRKIGLDPAGTSILDYFNNVFADHTIDIRTGELLGRYIAEEYDTGRLLRDCYEQLEAAEKAGAAAQNAGAAPAPVADQLCALTDRVDVLCRAVEELRQIVCAQAMPAEVH
jgi:rubrerythrin